MTTCHYGGDGHLLIVAGTGTGKTACVVFPTLLAGQPQDRHRSMVVNDPKGTLYWAYNEASQSWRGTAGYRATMGKAVLLAPFHQDTDTYNPWDSIRLGTDDEYGDAELLAHYLTNPEDTESHNETSRHFQSLANQVVAGIFLYGLHDQIAFTGAEFDALITQTPWDDLLTAMEQHEHPLVQRAAGVARMPGDRELGSLKTTLANAMRIFADPRIAKFTKQSTFHLTDLREQEAPCTVYVTIPFGQGKRLRPLARLLYAQMLTYCTARVSGWRHPLLAILEEFPSLGRFEFASDLLNYARETGTQLCLITPSMEEVIDTYGTHSNFLEGCRVQLVFGLTDAGVARKFAERVGTVSQPVERVTTQARGGRSITREMKEQDLLSRTALMELGEREVLLLAGRYKRILQQQRYYEQPVWDARSRLAPPARRPYVCW